MSVFDSLKPAFAKVAKQLHVSVDTPDEYTLVGKAPSPFPQHKGHPLTFGAVKQGKAYTSVHLLPIYMDAALSALISPELRKRMQGKSCFNFKAKPDPALLKELQQLALAGLKAWQQKKWI